MSSITSVVNSSDIYLGRNSKNDSICMYFKWKIHQVSINKYVISAKFYINFLNDVTRFWNYSFLVPTKTAESSQEFLSTFAENVIIDADIYHRTGLS